MKVIIIGKGIGWEDAPDHPLYNAERWGINDVCLHRDVDAVVSVHNYTRDYFTDNELDLVEKVKAYCQSKANPSRAHLWGITQLITMRPVDMVIDMNVYENERLGKIEESDAKFARSISSQYGIPYICLENYPLEAVCERFGTDYFGNTVDYAIALALFLGYDAIDFYGVNMLSHSEYSYQKSSVDFWCGMALGLGVKIRIYGSISTIMRTRDGRIYGYDTLQKMREVMAEQPKKKKRVASKNKAAVDFRLLEDLEEPEEEKIKMHTVACLNCRTYYEVGEDSTVIVCPRCQSREHRKVH